MARNSSRRMQIVHRHCAGIDIGGKRHFVAVDSSCCDDPVRSFDSFTDALEAMAKWLHECSVTVVAMESTGVYWIPVYEVLERSGFEVHLVNSRATKQVSGRKSDVLDCQWLQKLMSFGLLSSAFRAPDAVCELRAYMRQRSQLVRSHSRCVQHMQKALTQMNVQLANVISDITGKTGMQILRAIVAGERDGRQLARYRDGRIRADEETLARSLRGNWRDEHLFVLEQALAEHQFYNERIEACEQRILACATVLSAARPSAASARGQWETQLRSALHAMLGVDLTRIPAVGVETALVFAAEVGPDLSRFPSCAHFCSWLNLAPGTRISGGRKLPGRTPKVINRLGQALRMAATTARSSQTFIGAQHRARLARMDKPRAIKATAHQLARLFYLMLTRGEEYAERGIEYYEAIRRDKQLRAMQRRAQRMGFELVEVTA